MPTVHLLNSGVQRGWSYAWLLLFFGEIATSCGGPTTNRGREKRTKKRGRFSCVRVFGSCLLTTFCFPIFHRALFDVLFVVRLMRLFRQLGQLANVPQLASLRNKVSCCVTSLFLVNALDGPLSSVCFNLASWCSPLAKSRRCSCLKIRHPLEVDAVLEGYFWRKGRIPVPWKGLVWLQRNFIERTII